MTNLFQKYNDKVVWMQKCRREKSISPALKTMLSPMRLCNSYKTYQLFREIWPLSVARVEILSNSLSMLQKCWDCAPLVSLVTITALLHLEAILRLTPAGFQWLRPGIERQPAVAIATNAWEVAPCPMLLSAAALAAVGYLEATNPHRPHQIGDAVFKARVLHEVNERMRSPQTATSDSTISALLLLTSFEVGQECRIDGQSTDHLITAFEAQP